MKKIKILVILCFIIAAVETLLGFATLFSGILYEEYDQKAADEMLNVIKNTDINYYNKLSDPEDTLYVEEFKELHTKRGNSILILCGVIFLIIPIIFIIPLTLILMTVSKIEKPEKDEVKREETQPEERRQEKEKSEEG